ncbi:MAG: asparaginase [Campylobacteraceae bacterium]|nr:asparaginase [Campylobacteraceae bacterium]
MKITIINTGGTFNKKYNLIKGALDVRDDAFSLEKILNWTHNVDFEVKNILALDSLEIKDKHRDIIIKNIKESQNENIIIIHGTDTMNETALYLDERIKDKNIVITGAMIPMSIDTTEAVMNFASAYGFLNARVDKGIYIALHGIVCSHKKIYKDKKMGKFLVK